MHASRIFVICCALTLTLSQCLSETSSPQNGKNPGDQTTAPSFTGLGVAVPDDDDNTPSDYIPCLMDRKTLYAMRGRSVPNAATQISEKAAYAIVDATSSTITDKELNKRYKDQAGIQIQNLVQANALTLGNLYRILSNIASSVYKGTTGTEWSADQKRVRAQQEDALQSHIAATTNPASGKFPRPDDISCSMSVYPWNIARMIFGRTVAKNYLAVQVTVRNLDQDHEFLLHDAELAVDSNSGQLERFQSANEKQAVRAITLYGQNYDRRANWAHGVEGVGIILGSIVGVASADNLAAASGSYAAGFQPAFNKFFPDLSTSNLNNLNDLGFSAATASRIVVPKGGSVPFVVFVPIAPLEQACWLQRGYIASHDVYPYTACDAIDQSLSVSTFRHHQEYPNTLRTAKYQDWTPIQMAALEKHSFAVVAGSHIQNVGAQSAALRSITCTNTSDSVNVAALKGAPLTCILTGADLTTLTTLRLTPAGTGDPTKTIDLPITQSGDSAIARVTLKPDQLSSLTDKIYSLSGLDKSGNPSDLKLSFSILPLPKVSAVNPSTLQAASLVNQAATIMLTGSNLSQVVQVEFQTGSNEPLVITPKTVTDTQITITLPQMTPPAGTYKILLSLDPKSHLTADTGQTLIIN